MRIKLDASIFIKVMKETVLNVKSEMVSNVVRTVALTQMATMRRRIHQQGKASDGSLIGEYSTEPMYVSMSANIGSIKMFGEPVGKTGKSKFKNGKPHKSKYFKNGYKEFKTAIGRNELGTVNLSLSGQLNIEFTLIATEKGWGLGWENSDMLERAIFFEDKKYKKKIYYPTDDELETMKDVAKFELTNALSKATN